MASTALIISSHLALLLIILETGHAAAANHTGQPTAEAPGDIMIGILYPLHRAVEKNDKNPCTPWPRKCSRLDWTALTNVLIFINAIEKSNKSPLLTDVNITLGYRVLDYCGDVSTALRLTADLVQQHDCHAVTNTSTRRQPIMAVVGPPTSEVSIAIARQLNFNLIPQISPSSTAEKLNNKDHFPAFLRTVPSDKHQTAAMVHFIKNYNWSSVGVVTTDDECGSPSQLFEINALKEKICIAFRIVLPPYGSAQDKIRHAAEIISKYRDVKVIVSFASRYHMKSLLLEMKNQTLRNQMRRVWFTTDSWSTTGYMDINISLKDIGHIVGFTFKNGNVTSFTEYLSRLKEAEHLDSGNNDFLQELYKEIKSYGYHQTDAEVVSLAVEILQFVSRDATLFSLEICVSAIAHAVSSLCSSKDCKTPGKVQPQELLKILKEQEFELGGKTYNFTKEGDLHGGYVVTLWRSEKIEEFQFIAHEIMAEYDIITKEFTYTNLSTKREFKELENITSICSYSCRPGTFKKTAEGQPDCCYQCINCTKNHYSNETDMDNCTKCGKDEWSTAGSSNCRRKTVDYFSWDDSYVIALVTSTVLGIILVLMVSALFFHQADTPVVKAAGGPLCQIILFSLLVSYINTILFVGRPNSIQCKSRQVLFGISFTLCVSCILVKSLKILLAFQFNPGLQDLLRRLYRPYIIIGVVMGMQVIICTCWLLLRGPEKDVDRQDTMLLERCNEGSDVAFWVMLGYIAVLAFVCLVCAFKGRRLPRQYNDAKFITFSMLLNIISWMLFIPIHLTSKAKYLPAVEMIVILISNYSILCCHFFPKCYIILFKKEKNTTNAFKQNLFAYSNQTTDPFSVSGSSGSESQSSCQHIATSALTLSVPAAPLKPDVVTDYKETDTPVHLYPSCHKGSITHRRFMRRISI